jgi:transposase
MFTQEQIKKLLANKHVAKCSSESITYNKDFKVWAVKKYFNEGLSPNMIFEEAGFDLEVIGGNRPKECLRQWRKKYGLKGAAGLKEDDRGKHGGRKKELRFKNDKEKIKYLEAKVAYMDAENDFLAKLRGLKRE